MFTSVVLAIHRKVKGVRSQTTKKETDVLTAVMIARDVNPCIVTRRLSEVSFTFMDF